MSVREPRPARGTDDLVQAASRPTSTGNEKAGSEGPAVRQETGPAGEPARRWQLSHQDSRTEPSGRRRRVPMRHRRAVGLRRDARSNEILAVDAEVVEQCGVEVEKGSKRDALGSCGARFGDPARERRQTGWTSAAATSGRSPESERAMILLQTCWLCRRGSRRGSAASRLITDVDEIALLPSIRPTNRFHPDHQIRVMEKSR